MSAGDWWGASSNSEHRVAPRVKNVSYNSSAVLFVIYAMSMENHLFLVIVSFVMLDSLFYTFCDSYVFRRYVGTNY